MGRKYNCFQCTFLIATIFVVVSIFVSILIEESLYYFDKDSYYAPNDHTHPTVMPKTPPPVLSNVKLPNHDQEDPRLVDDLLAKMLPPCPHSKEYAGHRCAKAGGAKFKYIRKMHTRDGNRFFLECGAGDGSERSHTLYLEKSYFWQGLLVEADPLHFPSLIKLHRKAWIAPVCMSLNTSAYVAYFKSSPSFEGRVVTANESMGEDVVQVVCYPFYTFMLALSLRKIDYLRLRVAGHELEILKTIPFHKVHILFISLAYDETRGARDVIDFLDERGFDLDDKERPDEIAFRNTDADY